MKLENLSPPPLLREPFRRSRERFIPARSGCYALCTYDKDVLYVGLANNIRRRIVQHLDSPQKTESSKFGRAVFVYWLETNDINKVERTWLNINLIQEGRLPPLNNIYSPTAT